MSAPKSFYLSDNQLEGISILASDAGQVFLASMVVPFFTGLDTFQPVVLLLGAGMTLFCYFVSVYLRRLI